MTTKTIKVPFIAGLESMDAAGLDKALESAAKDRIDTVNWPEAYPVKPAVGLRVARSEKYLAVSYEVCGPDLRATQMCDNGRNWEDSCCEFFVEAGDGSYFNFETTCIGSVLMARGKGRGDRVQQPLETVVRVIRHSTLERREYDIEGGEHSWKLTILVPFEIIGLDGNSLPESVGANFYKCGDLTAHPHFVSWNPIPTPNPDFHRPEYFGRLVF